MPVHSSTEVREVASGTDGPGVSQARQSTGACLFGVIDCSSPSLRQGSIPLSATVMTCLAVQTQLRRTWPLFPLLNVVETLLDIVFSYCTVIPVGGYFLH